MSLPLVALLGACSGETKTSNTSAADAVGTKDVAQSPTFAKEIAAHEALNAGRVQDALRLYDELVALAPANVPVKVNRAVALTMLERYPEALTAIDECAALDPKDPEIHINRAQILHNLARHAEALEAIERAGALVGEAPSQLMVKTSMLKGRILVGLGRGPEAVALLDKLDQLSPNQPLVALERAHIYDRIGRRSDADQIWAALLQQFPSDASLQQAFQQRDAGAK